MLNIDLLVVGTTYPLELVRRTLDSKQRFNEENKKICCRYSEERGHYVVGLVNDMNVELKICAIYCVSQFKQGLILFMVLCVSLITNFIINY